MTITEFLEARIAEDEAAALPFRNELGDVKSWQTDEIGGVVRYVGPRAFRLPDRLATFDTHVEAAHVGRWHPARALAECAAKRTIMADTYWTHKERPTDAELHASNSNPAWEYETTEGQRKRWDDADEPPEGEGWERNTDKGRDGWDRFEYTEESYWRRLKPEADRREWKQYIPASLRALAAIYSDHQDYDPEWAL